MKSWLAVFIVLWMVFHSQSNYSQTIGYWTPEPSPNFISALEQYLPEGSKTIPITLEDLSQNSSLKDLDIIWLNTSDTQSLSGSLVPGKVIKNLLSFVRNGGDLVLTNQAGVLVSQLGIEPVAPVTLEKSCKDEGYGRMLGFHSFRSHPLFDFLNGGVYCLKPDKDTSVLQTGYFGEKLPVNGKVIAVDWDYIFLREEKKMIVEWDLGDGKILMIGGYLLYDIPNRNQKQLERFTGNIVSYLAGESYSEEHYWYYGPYDILPFTSEEIDYMDKLPATKWDLERNAWQSLVTDQAEGDYWDLAGEQMLVMGDDRGGIREIWSHPFMSLRDLEAGIMIDGTDSIIPLKGLNPRVTVSPWSLTREYRVAEAELVEIIVVSPMQPVAVIHYEYSGGKGAELRVRFSSNFRNMWPYSEKVLGGINYSWNESLNTFIMKDRSGDFVSMLGSNKALKAKIIGHNNIDLPERKTYPELSQVDFQVQGMMSFKLSGEEALDIIHTSSSRGEWLSMENYLSSIYNPGLVEAEAFGRFQEVADNYLGFDTPDPVFDLGYDWSLVATDRFFVNTPGIGSSLVAGYATSDKGWDGGQNVSGRPGYGWYFGRDGEWSGMALLHYGAFAQVKAMLETFIRFQDLDGKIFHELSTSGFVHYDAADATPLFIVLAGRYLRHSGDIAFIRGNWLRIQEAIDYCYSTDTDGDLLIENTNVGHGWVEGGSLYGSHTSLYLASCWAEALDQAAYMAKAVGLEKEATKFQDDGLKVKNLIDTLFWNTGRGYYYHGLKEDGSYIEEPSIMPAIPMLFGQSDQDKADQILPAFASNVFTSDWGCRIVGENSPLFNPNGYHTGSVWPLFTGWASLAEFKHHNYLQGFSHIMNNLLIYKHWGKGFLEEVLNGATFTPSGVCHHQCWSQTMVLQPAIEGMLGFEPDAMDNVVQLKPWFPADWDSVEVKRLKVGQQEISIKMTRYPDRTVYRFEKQGDERLDVRFSPVFPPGTEMGFVRINGQPAREPVTEVLPGDWVASRFGFWLDDIAEVVITHSGGACMLPIISNPQPGSSSRGFRILDSGLEDGSYFMLLQGRRTAKETFKVWIANGMVPEVENAEIISKDGNVLTLSTEFMDTETDYTSRIVRLKF